MADHARGSRNMGEVLIGAVVLAAAAAFAMFALTGANASGAPRGGYDIHARFSAVDGVTRGSDVRIAGVKVGSVTQIELDEYFDAVVTMSIDRDVRLSTDTSAKVQSDGLIGTNYIALKPGGEDTFLPDGGELTNAQGTVDLLTLITRFFTSGETNK